MSDKKKQKCREKQEKFRIVVYDTETCLNDNCEHFVNVLAYAIYCNRCFNSSLDTSCGACGVRKGVFRYSGPDADENEVITQFVDLILFEPRFNHAIIVAHNGGKFDHIFCLRNLYERGIAPKIVTVGTKIIAMRVKPVERGLDLNTLSFKDSYQLIPVSLAAMPEAFGFEDSMKGIFPYAFNKRENWGKTFPTHPPESVYKVDSMKEEQYKVFCEFYQNSGHLPYNFDEEITKYCENDVLILTKALQCYSQTMQQLTGWNPLIQVLLQEKNDLKF